MLAKVHCLAVLYEEVLGTLGNHVALPCGGGPGEALGRRRWLSTPASQGVWARPLVRAVFRPLEKKTYSL